MESSPVPLYHPLDVLKSVADNIWIVDGGIIHMAVGIAKIPFSTRMTVIRLKNGGMWCHSPIAPSEALFSQMNALGEVQYLISPNCIHYAYIAAWQQRYPQAVAWASPNVRERAAAQKISVTFDQDLGNAAPSEWADEISQHIFQGSRVMQEVVFFHHASKTLIFTDLIENFEIKRMGIFWRALAKLAGNVAPDGKAPIDLRATFTDRAAARESYAHIAAWQPEKILLAHGSCYFENALAELGRAFRWVK